METSENDIVISGISGRFPSSNNVVEFADNLYSKINMTDDSESRWNHVHDEVPKRYGKVNNLEKFDASFFSTLNKHANWTDPQIRILLEHSYESILDAGISPQSLVGSNTGVFIGCSVSEAKDAFLHRIPPKDGYVLMGNAQFYLANRISYALGLCGPSFAIDTACSSSAYALDCAYRYMEAGLCDSAIIGGSQLILNWALTVEYSKLGILSSDGISRPFDENATGFTRSESVGVVFLQKRKDAKRIYANVVYSNSNNDGFKKEGPSFPSKIMQQKMIDDFYKKINFDPLNVSFVEAHATSTKIGDPEEVAAITEVFCKNRSNQLVIGSVKSNMGHAEAASAVASIAKIIISFENRKIPPNINLKKLRMDVPAFADGRIKVATEVEDLHGEYIAMNSLGLGGGNAHSLYRGNMKEKSNSGIPADNFGRLVLWSGRTEAAINAIFDDIIQRPLDAEYIALLQNSQIQTTSANTYRGYGLFSHDQTQGKAICVKKNIQYFSGNRRPIVFVFSGIGSQWLEMGRDLLKIPQIGKSIDFCHQILLKKGIDLKKIITDSNEDTFNSVLNSYVGIIAIEIALTDMLRTLDINPDFIVGHSVGELGCAYADGCLTAEETILAAFSRGEASQQSKTIPGAMAAVGLSYMKLEEMLPDDIDIACHNGEDSTTISGPNDSVTAMIEKLKEKNIFVKAISCSGVPLHSRYIKEIGEKLLEKLKKVIKEPKKRSSKWLSSTYSEYFWNKDEALWSSADYHTNNLLNPVLFQEVTDMLPKDSLTIEVAPHGLLKAILKRNLKDGIHVSLTERNSKDGVEVFTDALGSLFQHGVDMDISKFYTPINYPVSRGTPMIAPIIKWNHDNDHYVPHFDTYNTFERRNFIINLSDREFAFIQHHEIDGRVLFPAVGWINAVWQNFCYMVGIHHTKIKVIIEDIHFLRATYMHKNQDILITLMINRGTGRFEIVEGNSAIAYGCVRYDNDVQMTDFTIPHDPNAFVMTGDDFYMDMRLRGFHHSKRFKGITELREDGLKGKIKWDNSWIFFLDSMTHVGRIVTRTHKLALPTYIRKVIINPTLHQEILDEKLKELDDPSTEPLKNQENAENSKEKEIILDIQVSRHLNIIKAGGIEIHGRVSSTVNRRRGKEPLFGMSKFIPFFSEKRLPLNDAALVVIQIALENIFQPKCSFIEIDSNDSDEQSYFCEMLTKVLQDIPQIVSNVTLLTKKENIQLENVTACADELTSFSGIDLIIKKSCIGDDEFIKASKSILTACGYIISIENEDFSDILDQDFQIIAKTYTSDDKIFYLLQFKDESKVFNPQNVIEITADVSEWLEPLKSALKEEQTVIYAYNQDFSGILGFMNCIRREYPNKLKCFFIMDTENAPANFDINDEFFKAQNSLNHSVNIFNDNKWGSYRHLSLPQEKTSKIQNQHCFINCLAKGDLSSLAWQKGSLDLENLKRHIVKIQFASLNFKDIMLALGRIPDDCDAVMSSKNILGLEFSGIKSSGERVMGIGLNAGAISTHYDARNAILWPVPREWTLEEAATIPIVYFTVYFAFFNSTTIKPGKKILIHSGSGGVGQAAIQVALAYGLKVFTTVSTEEKKSFLLNKFPSLKAENIGNSRDISFEKLIMEATDGKGVNYVLNSLAEDKLQASLRCLDVDGVFLEIGKYDMLKGSKLDMRLFIKRINFKAVIFDDLLLDENQVKGISELINKDIEAGIIRPLNTTVFEANQVEEAFRFMASGKHIGKILIKVRNNENDKVSLPIAVSSRTYFNENESIIITGGLGGFGLELAEWVASRGCKKLIISSSSGFRHNYQQLRVGYLLRHDINTVVSTEDIRTEEGCEGLIRAAMELGPVGAIFHLAGVIRDGIYENLDIKMFNETFAPKAIATKNLDKVSRVLCSNLKYFAVWSSISCGFGNAGQSNYGLSNSSMERVIEARHRDGLPAKAIQWGAIGDVGMLAEHPSIGNDKDFNGTLRQSIFSCLESLDVLLENEAPIVSSLVIAEKYMEDFKKGNIIDIILKIMGIRDRKSVSMNSTLTQLGIDSLMGIEIQQIIEREFEVSLTSQEMRSLTLNQIEKRILSKNSKDSSGDNSNENVELLNLTIHDVIDVDALELMSTTIIKANDVEMDKNTKVLIVPWFFGFATKGYKNLGRQIEYPAYILQHCNTFEFKSVDEIVEHLLPDVQQLFLDVERFIIIGHSFGVLLALKLAKILEDSGKCGQVIQLDGSPQLCQNISKRMSEELIFSDKSYMPIILFKYYQTFVDPNVAKLTLKNHDNWTDRIKELSVAAANRIPTKIEYLMNNLTTIFENRLQIALNLQNDEFLPLKNTTISLIRVIKSSIKGLPKDYGSSKYSTNDVKIKLIEGDHVRMLTNPELPLIIKSLL